jgi:hypothetical protein
MRIGGYVAFGLDCDAFDPGAAEIALRRSGYDVMRMPATFRSRLEIPQDDFLLVTTEVHEDRAQRPEVLRHVLDEVNAVVGRYGGSLDECGPINSHRAPFEELFEQLPTSH